MTTNSHSHEATASVREVVTCSEAETHHLGAALASGLPVPGVVLLRGALGVGKTTLARGLAEGLGLADPASVSSPSFTLVNIYQARVPIYHVDLYRLEGGHDLYSIGLDDFIGQDGITIVEWSERLPLAFDSALIIEIADAGGDCRRIRIVPGPVKRSIRKTRRPSSARWRRTDRIAKR